MFARATVAASPMVYGAGIQNKILEAMAAGVPVVTSPSACGSLTARPGDDLLVGETPAEVARHVIRVLDEAGLAERLRTAGLAYVRRCHDWADIGRQLAEIYRQAARGDRC